jgi:CBS domain containing-hemolysin-like protein
MGIVRSEDGKMAGIFTSQDIVEEIVGDIFEEEVVKNG